ncbi:SPT3 Dosage dependent suppressor of Ty-induced promoter mutations-like protein [Mortierella sp. GBA43]|nr:SPT3 Dosage dependent suppressor of Ty-induced promoter mutations-like protein [Mortierella sp. GBA43]
MSSNLLYHPLKYETGQSIEPPLPTSVTTMDTCSNKVNGYQANGWERPDGMLLNNYVLYLNSQYPKMSGYTLNARIIQKKDQMEEVLPTGEVIQAHAAEEVRTGQQFLIKLQLTKQGPSAQSPSTFPTMRVDRRDAINTAGEPRSDVEPLTLQIIVHLAKSNQIRKGACAKCCHKYGPTSSILVLLDPLSPSASDPSSYAHIDTSTGAITLLAKVLCSSTDHGERGNKDRYIFEFRLKHTSSMLSGAMGAGFRGDESDIVASCRTAPIMCSGHHKAKRAYPNPRLGKVTKEGVSPKTKVIKHHKGVPGALSSVQTSPFRGQNDDFHRSDSISSNSNYPSPLSLMQDNITSASVMSSFDDDQLGDIEVGSSTADGMLLSSTMDSPAEPSPPAQLQPPSILEVRPDHGPIRRTTDVVLRGTFFREGMTPYFGCFPALDVSVETSSLIICKAPEYSMAVTVPVSIYDRNGGSFGNLSQFTYTEESETELLILQLQLRMAHRALEFLHSQTTGQHGNATDIMRDIGITSSTGGSHSTGNMMMDSLALLTREQVEDGILSTLDQLPNEVDISMSLDDNTSLLHLSILLNFDRLTVRLIEGGCDIEAADSWGLTPLIYAVLKGNERVVRSLVMAGATSSGSKTPQEFYARLPHAFTPTVAVMGYLSVACTRYSASPDALVSGQEEAMEGSDCEIDCDIQSGNNSGAFQAADQTIPAHSTSDSTATATATATTTATVGGSAAPADEGSDLAQIARNIQGVHLSTDMPPLDQQGLPQMHVESEDGTTTVNNTVLKGGNILSQTLVTSSGPKEDSAYHSGLMEEFQGGAPLPSDGVEMKVVFSDPNNATEQAGVSTHLGRSASGGPGAAALDRGCSKCPQKPIVTFHVPLDPAQPNTPDEYVVEMKKGLLSVQARVNCSSTHHATGHVLQPQQQGGQSLSSSSSSASSSITPTPTPTPTSGSVRVDPGYVFKFELVHPTLSNVVATCEAMIKLDADL